MEFERLLALIEINFSVVKYHKIDLLKLKNNHFLILKVIFGKGPFSLCFFFENLFQNRILHSFEI